MGNPLEAVSASVASIQAAGTQARFEATQGALAQGAGATIDPQKATIASIGDFQKNYPALWNAFLQAWASMIQTEQQHREDHLEDVLREERSRNGG